jgi:toxin ParE1/3/4
MVEIRWTSEAEKWLRDIYDYIARDNPIAAQKVVTQIYQKAENLKDFPEIGYRYRDETDGEIRILLYGHYRIAYFINKTENSVDIIGVFHGSLDIERYL